MIDDISFLRSKAAALRQLAGRTPAIADELRRLAGELEAKANELERSRNGPPPGNRP